MPLLPAQVFLAETDSPDVETRWPDLQALLSPQEREKAARFHFERDRRIYTVAHVLLRRALSTVTGEPLSRWSFVEGAHGKPEIAPGIGPPLLRFNLTHTHGLAAAVVVTDGTCVGIDAEHAAADRAALQVADSYFAAPEVAELRALPPERQPERFFQLWTLKEAYLKAHGAGLNLPLHAFGFRTFAPGSLQVWFDPTLREDPAEWAFGVYRATPSHLVAVGARLGGRTLDPRVVRVDAHGGIHPVVWRPDATTYTPGPPPEVRPSWW